VGRSDGIIIWDAQILELVGFKIGTYGVCCQLKSLKDNFALGLIGVDSPNDDNLSYALFDELKLFMSHWEI